MIVVDSSVWIDFFAARDTEHTRLLKHIIGKKAVIVPDLVLAEVLQGIRHDQSFRLAHDLLSTRKIVIVCNARIAVAAAENYRLLRARGITIRKTIDTLIATRCIADELPLLYRDRDFDPFVEHLKLKSALDFYGTS